MNNYQGSLQPEKFPPLPSGWISDWETYPSSDGVVQLYGVNHHKKDPTRPATLMILHGMGEHGGRYLHFPEYLKNEIDSVYCLDHRGHGRSEGLRGHVERFDIFAEDVILTIKRLEESLKKKFGRAEIHLFAHSLGGLIALRALLLRTDLPLMSVTISSPLLGVKVAVPLVKKSAGYLLSSVWGNLQMTNVIDPSVISRDPAVVETYVKDRLNHAKVTPKFFTELEKARKNTLKRGKEIHYPTLFTIAMQDKLVDPEVAIQFYQSIGSKDKSLQTYPDFYHESFNEPEKEKAFEDLRKWIKIHEKN